MKVREPRTLAVYTIEMRRPDQRIAMAGEVAVALVVGDDEHDVWPGAGQIVCVDGAHADGD